MREQKYGAGNEQHRVKLYILGNKTPNYQLFCRGQRSEVELSGRPLNHHRRSLFVWYLIVSFYQYRLSPSDPYSHMIFTSCLFLTLFHSLNLPSGKQGETLWFCHLLTRGTDVLKITASQRKHPAAPTNQRCQEVCTCCTAKFRERSLETRARV